MSTLSSAYIRKLQTKPDYPKYISIHWADYIELLCLANIDGELSEEDIIGRFVERERDLLEGDPSDIDELKDFEAEDETATRRAEIDDKWQIQLNDWFKLLSVRASAYGNKYPFIITGNEIKRRKKITSEQKSYIYLLLCSNLYLFDKKNQGILANNFEMISSEVLKNLLPKNAEIHVFGNNPLNSKSRYSSNTPLWDKMTLLAADLYEQLNPQLKKASYPATNKGDDGLDIVAWLPTGDSLPSLLVFFGQCACTTDWVNKQNDSDYAAWTNKINLTNRTNNIIFIPFCYRGADGKWFKPGDIRLSFLIDRKRILHYLGNYRGFNRLKSAIIVNTIIKTQEGVV